MKELEYEDLILAKRGANLSAKNNPKRAVQLGFVDLQGSGHVRPQRNTDYAIVSASSDEVGKLPHPATSRQLLDVDIYGLYSGDLPEGIFGGRNEGLLRLKTFTANPQDVSGSDAAAAYVRQFQVDDDSYAPGFLLSGVFRRVLINGLANLSVDLFEMDNDASQYFTRFKSVVDKVPEMQSLDVIKGIPYLSLATNIAEAVIDVFGKNADDYIWGEMPILEIEPLIGGAFLRDGIYILIEKRRDKQDMLYEDLHFRNGQVVHKKGYKLGAHLIFALRLRDYTAGNIRL